MDIELAKCECCGLKEDCTQAYISEVKEKFDGKWLCGLCSEAVRDEIIRGNNTSRHMMFVGIEDAVKAHMSFCRKYKSNNPATRGGGGDREVGCAPGDKEVVDAEHEANDDGEREDPEVESGEGSPLGGAEGVDCGDEQREAGELDPSGYPSA
nr:uncharacterized protein LOC109163807 [Ipomoea batatas]